MSKKDNCLAYLIAIVVAFVAFLLKLDYKDIASEGLTLSSIVLAVYVAAMMGLIGSKLGEKMASTPTVDGEHTQLGVLRIYFKKALLSAGATIVISSIVLLLPEIDQVTVSKLQINFYRILSALGVSIYAVNLFFMGMILKFMLNRQIWNT